VKREADEARQQAKAAGDEGRRCAGQLAEAQAQVGWWLCGGLQRCSCVLFACAGMGALDSLAFCCVCVLGGGEGEGGASQQLRQGQTRALAGLGACVFGEGAWPASCTLAGNPPSLEAFEPPACSAHAVSGAG
jgi:hypothetical protein